jgi:hypothetical protein
LEYACASDVLSASFKGIVLLGVPNCGTLTNKKIVKYMVDWGEQLTGPNPFHRSKFCRSSQQLTGNDSEHFLQSLASRATGLQIPLLSCSGGRSYLECGTGLFDGVLRNRILQALIGERPNDGLVAESSADATRLFKSAGAQHRNDYTDFEAINHTFLPRNQQILEIIASWLESAAFKKVSA